jgi:hypothetical protein
MNNPGRGLGASEAVEEAEENFIGEEDPNVADFNVGPSQQLGIGANLPLSNQFNRKVPRNVTQRAAEESKFPTPDTVRKETMIIERQNRINSNIGLNPISP